MTLHRPWRSTSQTGVVVDITPEDAGWAWTGLRVVALQPGQLAPFFARYQLALNVGSLLLQREIEQRLTRHLHLIADLGQTMEKI